MQCMIIPAAGRGTRLNSDLPKLLFKIQGVSLIEYVLRRHSEFIQHFVVVIHPDMQEAVSRELDKCGYDYSLAYQTQATGMLDAILLASDNVRTLDPTTIWISWCDQVAISQKTASTLNQFTSELGEFGMALPTMTKSEPYIHLSRNTQGQITDILQRREGDAMPRVGENDCGLFAMTIATYLQQLPEFTRSMVIGTATAERNFLPFIPWLTKRAAVNTFAVENINESIGVNTIEEAETLAKHFQDI
ncbi:MAG: bifunctional UDP-N-acetylglucosamine pyrophosphorylase/glucosamine-1-phosphate N-acetyltransferase [Parasphingorhabdus sp.]|jgi:bifunctional UDP-N-acetylglucosamine pyrophosphorylase/glucosamine-1-phosphate N-acetyltransferase